MVMIEPSTENSMLVLVILVAVLAAVLVSGAAFGSVGDIRADAAVRPDLPTELAIPLADNDRLPDLNMPAVVLRILPESLAASAMGDWDTLLNAAIVSDARAHQGADYEDIFAGPGVEAMYAALGSARPSVPPPAARPRPLAWQAVGQLSYRLAVEEVPAMLNVIAVDGARPVVRVPIPVSPQATPVDFTALLNAEGDVVLDSPGAEGRDVLVRPGRFALDTLELGRAPTRLEMDRSRFAVADGVHLMPNGRIITHIYDEPAGLDLSADAVLDIHRGAKIVLLWHGAPAVEGIHWGMRAKGDRREEFRHLIATGRILVGKREGGAMAISKAVIIFDGEYTYITIDYPVYDKPINSRALEIRIEPEEIPEPASIALFGLGACLALFRRKRRQGMAALMPRRDRQTLVRGN